MNESFLQRVQRWFALKPAALRSILGINAAVYLAWVIVGSRVGSISEFVLGNLLAKSTFTSILFKPWTLLSNGFLHLEPGFWGLISFAFVMLWLVWLGQEFEELYGTKRMWQVYLGSIVAGSLLFILVMSIFTSSAFLYGGWAAVFGIGAVQATINPNKSIGLFLLGVVPLKWVLVGFGLLMLLFNPAEGVAAAGAGLFGVLFAKFGITGFAKSSSSREAGDGSILNKLDSWLGSRPGKEGRKAPKSKPRSHLRKVDISDAKIESEISEDEVDAILEKISAQGFDSLTMEEKQKLYAASGKDQ